MTLTNKTIATLLVLAISCIVFLQAAQAQSPVAFNPAARVLADMARKGYTETVEDMHVKVLGGYIRVNRTLVGNVWKFNENWASATATSGCAGFKIVRGQYEYNYTGTQTVSYQGTDHQADTFTYFTDRRFVAIRDPNNPPPETIISASGSSGGDSQGPTRGCATQPTQFLLIRWEDSFGNWIEYDGSNGRILRYGDRNNVQVSFDYDANGNLEGVNDHFGTRMLTYQYQAYASKDRVISITDYTNRQVQYIWSADGSTLDKVIDVRGKEWLYTYDSKGRLTKVVDPEGRQKIITLSATGSVESVIMAEAGETEGVGTEYSYAYDQTNNEFTAIQRKTGGREESVTYDEDGFIIRKDLNGTTLYTLEILNGTRKRVRTETNGNTTTSEYDERNNLIKETYADGSVITMTYNEFSLPLRKVDEVGTVTLYDYDANGNLERITEAAGTSAERVIEYDYDQYGQTEVILRLGDNNTQTATTTFAYDNFGNVRTATDPMGELSEWTYDVMGNVLVHTDRRGKLWTRTYDESGNMTSVKNPLNNVEKLDYDGVGNLIKYTDSRLFETEFEFDARDNLIATSDALDGRYEYAYDDNNMPISRKDAEGKIRTESYDPSGRVEFRRDGADNITTISYDDKSKSISGLYLQPTKVTFPTYATTLSYDRRGRVVSLVDDLGTGGSLETLFEYDSAGRIASRTDPRGSTARMSRDALGRVGLLADALLDETETAYDDRDNVVAITDPRSKTIRFEYDLNDRIVTEVKPLGQQSTHEYDEEGNLTNIYDANGQRIKFGYDDASRLISVDHYRDAASAVPDRSHTLGYSVRDLLESWDDGITSGTRTYDELGRLTAETVNYGGFSLSYSLTYNANSTIDTFTDADGTVYRYLYDSDNKPQGMIIPGVGTIAVNEYVWRAPKKITLPGGTTEEYQYTPYLEEASISVNDAANTVIASRSMSYDTARNLETRNTEIGDATYSYDPENRLTGATRSGAADKTYTYDELGNRLTLDDAADIWQYDDNNRLLAAGSATYDYDDNGNVIGETRGGQSTHYFYDVANRLERVEDSAGNIIAQYGYDGFSRRIWKEVAGVRTYFFYSFAGLIGEYDSAGSVQKAYGYFPGSPWSTDPVYMKTTDGYNFYHKDQLGTPFMLTDQNGAVTWKTEIDPFGKNYISIGIVTNNFRFPGQYYDAETGFHYNFFRTYDPNTGRYLESDPIGVFGGLNTYAYADQNPLRKSDPLGLTPGQDSFIECLTNWTNPYPENCFAQLLYDIGAATPGAIADAAEELPCLPGCEDPFEIRYHYGLPHAPIKPSVTKQYSPACLATLGLYEGAEEAIEIVAADAAKEAAEKAGKTGVARIIGVITSLPGQIVMATYEISNLFEKCECE